ncbi:MAG: hypothetical protein V4572_08280 [Bacteroidota bacterium]
MRPIIDPNNLVHSEETRVYISRGTIDFSILMLVLVFGFSLYLLYIKEYFSALIAFAFPCFFINKIKPLVAEWEVVQMRINSQGIQIKNELIIPWDKIENERIVQVISNETDGDYYEYFAFYDANNHRPMQFEESNFNLSPQELLLSAKIHRARFNSMKNNS